MTSQELVEALVASGLTANAVAAECGVSHPQIYRAATGERTLREEAYRALLTLAVKRLAK